MASFDNAGSDVFKEEWLKYGVEPDYGSYYIAVDLAGFEEVAKQAANSKKRLDQTAISVVKVTDDGKWFVKEIAYGRWDIRETAATILLKMREYRPLSVGIERGSLKNAVLPYLSDLMRKNNDKSGLLKFFDIAQHMGAFTRIEFTPDDIVRSSLVKDYILAKLKYEDIIEGKPNANS